MNIREHIRTDDNEKNEDAVSVCLLDENSRANSRCELGCLAAGGLRFDFAQEKPHSQINQEGFFVRRRRAQNDNDALLGEEVSALTDRAAHAWKRAQQCCASTDDCRPGGKPEKQRLLR